MIKTGIVGGLIAGFVFMIMEMILVATVGGGSAFGPPRMIAAIVMGEGVLPPPATFEPTSFIVGMIVHFVLSAVLGVIFAAIAGRLNQSNTMLVILGAVFGLVVYVVTFYGFTAAFFPWFEMARGWIAIVSHLAFGAVLGWWVARHRTVVTT